MTAGWPRLLRLALRRDRVLVPVWIVALVGSCVGSVQATVGLYPSAASRAEAASGITTNPALRAFYGPIADVTSEGAFATFKLLLLGGVFVAMLTAVVVRRHTRLEEESGRAELLASTAVGRHALLTAALVEAVGASLMTGLLVGLGNAAVGLDLGPSLAFGGAWAGLGLVGAAVAAVAVQLTASTRTAGGLIAAVLGATYLLRAVGDALGGGWRWLDWLSPFGWASRTDAYGDTRWWMLLLPVLLLAVAIVVAHARAERRDLGSGLLPARSGPANGVLRTVGALEVRLARSGLIGWSLAMLAIGLVFGGIAPGVADVAGSPETEQMLRRVGGPGSLVDAFLGTELAFMALAVTAYGVAIVVRAAGEEDAGRTEQVLAAGGTRDLLLGSTAFVALAGPALLLLLCGVGAGLAYGAQEGGIGDALVRLVPAALAPLPAVWVVVGLTLFLLGARRSWAVLGWALLAAFLLLGQMGEMIGLPTALTNLSPYAHVPNLPGGDFAVGPELALTAIAAVAGVLALWRYRARDLG